MEIVQVAQGVVDLDRAAAFYERLLGVPPTGRFDPPGLVFFRLGAVRLLLETGAPGALVYLSVPDVVATVRELAESGVRVVGEPAAIFRHLDSTLGPAGTEEWMGFIEDSEGNTVGLVSWLPIPSA
ncbi:VOC family protein [Sinomonas sp. ASV322]|uniref:VOC family protein n=1 Tax=Sinomonas sp. ASV322 TaxID=3041920 RepID=UPI0027DB2BDB|nr:VOC family protein [Sinomonas sp. ASV322]MDQ4501076.1 methylmalonyl-CoA epimerase [Sinomonas sp. ASV322]